VPTVAERIASDRDERLLSELIAEFVTERNGKFAIAESAFKDWSTDDVKDLAVHFHLVVDRSALSESRSRISAQLDGRVRQAATRRRSSPRSGAAGPSRAGCHSHSGLVERP
jgi:hypothetical protein